MMRVGGDYHLAPGEVLNDYLDVAVGDMIDVIPLGVRAYMTPEGQRTIKSIAEHVKVYVAGNHDPYKALVKLFKGYDICIHQSCEFFVEHGNTLSLDYSSARYFFRHGDTYAPDWWVIRRFAYTWTELVTRFSLTRKLWYKFCRYKNWMGEKKPRSKDFKFNRWIDLV